MPLRECLGVGDRLLKNGKLYVVSSVDGSLFIYRDMRSIENTNLFKYHTRQIKDIPDNELETYIRVKVHYGEAQNSAETKGNTDG